MKKLSVIRLAKYRTSPDWKQQGLLPSELEALLPGKTGKAPASPRRRKKKTTAARSSRRS